MLAEGKFEIFSTEDKNKFVNFLERYFKSNEIEDNIIQSCIMVAYRTYSRDFSKHVLTNIINEYCKKKDIINFEKEVLLALFTTIPNIMIDTMIINKIVEIPLNIFLTNVVIDNMNIQQKNVIVKKIKNFTIENIIKELNSHYDTQITQIIKNIDIAIKLGYTILPENVFTLCDTIMDRLMSRKRDENIDTIKNLLDYLDKLKYVISYSDLASIYKYGDIEIIKLFLSKSGYKVNGDCINNLLDGIKERIVCDYNIAKNMANILDLSITFGYNPTLDDIKKACNKNCYFTNVNKYGIPIEEILNLQKEVEYFPYILKDNDLVPNILLYKIFDAKTVAKFKKEISLTNIIPNIYCSKNCMYGL